MYKTAGKGVKRISVLVICIGLLSGCGKGEEQNPAPSSVRSSHFASVPATISLNIRVMASSDDAEEKSGGTMSLTSSDLELIQDVSKLQTVGVRFAGVTVPPGAVIMNAYVQFTVDETSSNATALTFQGHAADTSATFTTATSNVSSRPRTAASVSWSPPAWGVLGETGANQRTPDVSAILQEIVNRPGWQSGNALSFIITGSGKRVAEAYDGVPSAAPLLYVEYGDASTVTTTTTMTTTTTITTITTTTTMTTITTTTTTTTTTTIISTSQHIKIASFNIAELGNPKKPKDNRAIAQMLYEFDLIVIQEVQDSGGAQAVSDIRNALNNLGGTPYQEPLVIPNAGRGFPGNEGYAFVYRSPVALDNRVTPAYAFRYDHHDIYGRIPAFAYFKAGTFDFVIAALHLQWSNIDRRRLEIKDVKNWLIEFAGRQPAEERDLIVVGDVNRYGNLASSVIEQHQAPFDAMVDAAFLGRAYRLITLEFLPTPDTRFAPLDAQSTTIADSKDLYDQIFIAAGAFREHEASPSRFGEDVGTIAYDMEVPWKDQTQKAIKSAISDHRPVWAKFRIDLPDDDGG